MYTRLLQFLEAQWLGELAPTISYIIFIGAGLVVCIVVRNLLLQLLLKFFRKITKKEYRPAAWVAVLIKNKFFAWLSNLTIPVIVSLFAADIGIHPVFWSRTITVLLVVTIVFLVDSFIRSIGDIYNSYEVSKAVPLRGMLQVMEIAVFVVGAIVLISVFVDRNPAALLGGIGAMTAIVTIVFKDAILGFIAGIQIAANDMVRVGDIIEFPKRDIIGTVFDISLITVKVEALDKTIVAIPTYTFISEPFVNRRGMIDAGVRRIKRSFNIDANTVRMGDDVITNLETFRQYIAEYLRGRSDINQDLTILVRQLQAEDIGIPLEVYAFAATTELVAYENIQSCIFDHIYAVMPQFGLKLYQKPTGSMERE